MPLCVATVLRSASFVKIMRLQGREYILSSLVFRYQVVSLTSSNSRTNRGTRTKTFNTPNRNPSASVSDFIHPQQHKMSYRSPSVYSDFDENEVYYDGGVSSSRSRHGSSSRRRSTLYGNGLGEFPYRSRKDSSSRSGGLGTLLESSYSPPRRESSRSRRSSRRETSPRRYSSRRETSPPRYSSRRETSPPRYSSRREASPRRSSSRRESTSNRRLGELGLPSSSRRYSSSRRETSPPRRSSRRESSRLGELGLPSSSRSSDRYSSSRRRESTSDRYGSSSRYESSRDRYRYY
jgi:hypothetical protein